MNQPTTGILGYSSKPWGGWGFLVFVGAVGLIIGTGMFLNGLWNLLNNLDEVHKRQLSG